MPRMRVAAEGPRYERIRWLGLILRLNLAGTGYKVPGASSRRVQKMQNVGVLPSLAHLEGLDPLRRATNSVVVVDSRVERTLDMMGPKVLGY